MAMHEMEKINGFSDIKFGIWARRTTYHAIMCINTMINQTHKVRAGDFTSKNRHGGGSASYESGQGVGASSFRGKYIAILV